MISSVFAVLGLVVTSAMLLATVIAAGMKSDKTETLAGLTAVSFIAFCSASTLAVALTT